VRVWLARLEQRLAAMESRSEGPAAERLLDGGEASGGLNDPNLTLSVVRGSTSEDLEEVSEMATLSEETAQVVNAAFKTPLANTARQALRRQFGVPKLDTTKCPKLDTVIKCNFSKEVKDADSQFARIHTLQGRRGRSAKTGPLFSANSVKIVAFTKRDLHECGNDRHNTRTDIISVNTIASYSIVLIHQQLD
jgi:hypothetical protein